MKRANGSSTVFVDRVDSFNDILNGGKLGGSKALVAYLNTRSSQIMRLLPELETDEDERRRAMVALDAIADAIPLVELLINPNTTPSGSPLQNVNDRKAK